ncbi:MAG: hypothetical protein K2G49_00625 [Muribaculum sp.]|nr:hypothetical protein [Muribaculum sp.]
MHCGNAIYPRRGCRHIYVTSVLNTGELPLAPTPPAWTIIDNALKITSTLHRVAAWTIHDDALKITATLHRVAVGATGRSPATHAQRKRGLSPEGIIHV